MKTRTRFQLIFFFIFLMQIVGYTQSPVGFTRNEAMIQMRDGVKLHTVVLTPESHGEALPILLLRTPYGVSGNTSESVNSRFSELIKDGYIFVFQDIRGRYASEGEFLMNRPLKQPGDKKGIDESTDTFDSIDWLVKNLPRNNGRVGMFGISYPGWLAATALINPHPALKATSPQAPMVDTWMGDDFFHNGAFRQTYGYEYVKSMETNKEGIDISFGTEDAYDVYLNHKSLQWISDEFAKKMPSWNGFAEHPAYDQYWQERASQLYIKRATLPTLIVGGWWDQEDMFGPLALYKALHKTDPKHLVSLVMGPWNHGGWAARRRYLDNVDFGGDQSKYYRENIEAPWFANYLHDNGKHLIANATIFQTGTNKWIKYTSWSPQKNVVPRNLYLQSDGKLSFSKPKTSKKEFDSYVSDPANPVPYRARPIAAVYDYSHGSKWSTWLTLDQRFLEDRRDLLSWKSDVLDNNLTLSGDMMAHLFASTSGSDSDWIVKLIDIRPDGYQMMVSEEIFRGRYRQSFTHPTAIVPGKVNEYKIDLRGNNYSFLKGHRLMVEVQSSWFPLYDRNPQNFVANIFLAKESDYQSATQKIFHSPRYPSNISVFMEK